MAIYRLPGIQSTRIMKSSTTPELLTPVTCTSTMFSPGRIYLQSLKITVTEEGESNEDGIGNSHKEGWSYTEAGTITGGGGSPEPASNMDA